MDNGWKVDELLIYWCAQMPRLTSGSKLNREYCALSPIRSRLGSKVKYDEIGLRNLVGYSVTLYPNKLIN